ncbi:VCBS repeat-containing protein [uncultured Pseudokineococcus sp.]|uniref:FG-GAP repeat domain-containing protein n=1 Tax=uncultured Pseudokineococcus sp. TaxID=1642928 RepID=UPI00261E3664|nr:VCBS repeat-containing protein [uncultured Pseudokineococcus sp.]
MHRTAPRVVVAATAAAVAAVVTAGPALAAPGDLDVYLADPQDRGRSVSELDVGNVYEGDVPLVCDAIDAPDGAVTFIFSGGFWYAPSADGEVSFGRPGDVPLCGAWGFAEDGAPAQDTFAVRRGNRYLLSAEPAVFTGGRAAQSFVFGQPSDQALVGDWDGDGIDTIAVRRGNTTYYANDNVDGGGGVRASSFGRATDIAVAGDFDGDGRDTIAVRRGSTFFVSAGEPGGRLTNPLAFQYGRSTDVPVAGSVLRDEGDFLGVVRIEG